METAGRKNKRIATGMEEYFFNRQVL